MSYGETFNWYRRPLVYGRYFLKGFRYRVLPCIVALINVSLLRLKAASEIRKFSVTKMVQHSSNNIHLKIKNPLG